MIYLIIILAFLIRIISLNQSLWLDEGISTLAAEQNNLIDYLTKYSLNDFHPPGYFFIIWDWTHLFGFSEISVRLPSVIFGVLTVSLIYLIGKKISSEKLGFIAAALLAVNPLHIYYSQEARMYSFAAFAAAFSSFAFLMLLDKEKNSKILYFLSLILVVSSDYVAYLIIPAQALIVILKRDRRLFFSYLTSSLGAFLIWLLWLPLFLRQLGIGTEAAATVSGWREVVGSASAKELMLTYVKFIIGRISYPDFKVYLALFTPAGLIYLFLLIKGSLLVHRKRYLYLFSWCLVPLTLAFFISFKVPIYSYFRMLFVLPSFLLIVGLGILSLKTTYQQAALIILILIELICSSVYLFNPQFQREDWKGLVRFFQKQPETSYNILFESNGAFSPFLYYAGNSLNITGGLKSFPVKSEEDTVDLNSLKYPNQRIFLVEYLVDITDPQRFLKQKIDSSGYTEKRTYDFHGVGFVHEYFKK
jgi:mannosyltransferase